MNESMKHELLIKGGHVIDPANNTDAIMDVAVKDGKISAVSENISPAAALKTVDAEGIYVVPGLIDMHAHVYPFLPSNELPFVNAEAHCITSGVTTVVDAGTTGPRDFIFFKENVIDKCPVRVLAFINIASGGMVHLPSEQTPREFYPELCAAYAKTFSDVIVGIKSAHYLMLGQPYDAVLTPWASIDAAIKAGELADVPVMLDVLPREQRSYRDLILEKTRPGDIHPHFLGDRIPTLDENGKVYDYMFKARERGSIFDLGHGQRSFRWRNAVPAWEQGFYPDTISTDLHIRSLYSTVLSMVHVMSKCITFGMPLQEVIKRSTCAPAKLINRPDLGTLSVGAGADIALLEITTGKFHFIDGGNTKMEGDKKLSCIMTIRAGKILYDLYGMSMNDWKDECLSPL